MALNTWLLTGALTLPFSATESMNTNPNASIISGILGIDDSENGDGSPPARVETAITDNATYRTLLVVTDVQAGEVRVNVGGEHGAWHSVAGVYNETIIAGPSDYIEVEYAAFTVAKIALVMVQPA